MRININLLPGAKRKRGGGGGGFQLPDFKELASKIRDPLLIGAVGAWVVAIAVVGVMFVTQSKTKTRLVEELGQVEREHRRFRGLLQRTERAQALQDSLLVELDAIRRIDRNRYIWPHIMTDVSMALPQFAWLTEVRSIAQEGGGVGDTLEAPLQIVIEGQTVSYQAYTRFIRGLNESPWLRNVTPGNIQTSPDEQGNRLYAFNVTATFQQADASLIQTVPVADWLR